MRNLVMLRGSSLLAKARFAELQFLNWYAPFTNKHTKYWIIAFLTLLISFSFIFFYLRFTLHIPDCSSLISHTASADKINDRGKLAGRSRFSTLMSTTRGDRAVTLPFDADDGHPGTQNTTAPNLIIQKLPRFFKLTETLDETKVITSYVFIDTGIVLHFYLSSVN